MDGSIGRGKVAGQVMGNKIKYREGYKYQLAEDYSVQVNIFPSHIIETDYIILTNTGLLIGKRGYAWDGASGPAIDTKNFMRGSLVHDELAQLMRQGLLEIKWLDMANRELCRICREDGMSWIRAQWVYWGVTLAGDSFARAGTDRPILEAP